MLSKIFRAESTVFRLELCSHVSATEHHIRLPIRQIMPANDVVLDCCGSITSSSAALRSKKKTHHRVRVSIDIDEQAYCWLIHASFAYLYRTKISNFSVYLLRFNHLMLNSDNFTRDVQIAAVPHQRRANGRYQAE